MKTFVILIFYSKFLNKKNEKNERILNFRLTNNPKYFSMKCWSFISNKKLNKVNLLEPTEQSISIHKQPVEH